MKISARNQLEGTVKKVKADGLSAVVTVKLSGGHTLTAQVTAEAVKELKLKAGKPVTAVIKASSVLLGVE